MHKALPILAVLALVVGACAERDQTQNAGEGSAQKKASSRGSHTSTVVMLDSIEIKVLAVRAWSPPEPRFALLEQLPNGPWFYLQMDGVSLSETGMPSMLAEGMRNLTEISATGNTFVRKCVRATGPTGRFVEVLLQFENRAGSDRRQSITGGIPGSLELLLEVRDHGVLSPVDFVGPGFYGSGFEYLRKIGAEGLTVATEFTGDMQVFLKPGGKTWCLLLYDVPSGVRGGWLLCKGAPPLTLGW